MSLLSGAADQVRRGEADLSALCHREEGGECRVCARMVLLLMYSASIPMKGTARCRGKDPERTRSAESGREARRRTTRPMPWAGTRTVTRSE